MKIISTFVVVLLAVLATTLLLSSSTVVLGKKLKDTPTGGTVTVSPSYFEKATAHLSSAFDQSVQSSFNVNGLQGPLPSLSPCIINYDNVKLKNFTETGITYAAVPTTSNSTTTATHQIIIHNPVFTLETLPYSALCAFASGVGNLQMQATGSITGTWSAANLTIEVTEAISGSSKSIVVATPTIKTVFGMQLAYTYDVALTNNNFLFDDFWKHHVQTTMQNAVNAELTSLFNNGGAPISILVNNMNALLTQWPQVCGIDQMTIPGTLILNTEPLCRTVIISDLAPQDLCVVQVSASSSAEVAATNQAATCESETCWSPTSYPNNGNILITYNNCIQCNTDQGKITGTSGLVLFNGNN